MPYWDDDCTYVVYCILYPVYILYIYSLIRFPLVCTKLSWLGNQPNNNIFLFSFFGYHLLLYVNFTFVHCCHFAFSSVSLSLAAVIRGTPVVRRQWLVALTEGTTEKVAAKKVNTMSEDNERVKFGVLMSRLAGQKERGRSRNRIRLTLTAHHFHSHCLDEGGGRASKQWSLPVISWHSLAFEGAEKTHQQRQPRHVNAESELSYFRDEPSSMRRHLQVTTGHPAAAGTLSTQVHAGSPLQLNSHRRLSSLG